jgi:hypothetical protein
MAENLVFRAGNYWKKQFFQFQISSGDLQPSKNGQKALNCGQKILLRSEIFIHTSDSYLLEPLTPLLLKGVNDVLHADLPLKSHTSDVLQVDEGFPYAFSRPYISPLQHGIDLTCARLCRSHKFLYWLPFLNSFLLGDAMLHWFSGRGNDGDGGTRPRDG